MNSVRVRAFFFAVAAYFGVVLCMGAILLYGIAVIAGFALLFYIWANIPTGQQLTVPASWPTLLCAVYVCCCLFGALLAGYYPGTGAWKWQLERFGYFSEP